MLRFANPTDAVFTAILHAALEMVQDEFDEPYLDDDDKKDFWEAQYPNAAKVFSTVVAKGVVDQLLEVSRRPGLYQLTDYHWLLLYDVLHCFIEVHNDMQAENDGLFPVGPYSIGEIDFDFIVEFYFWDTDFLIDSETMVGLTTETKEAMALNPEVFGLAQGLAPHPDELKIMRWDESETPSSQPVPPNGSIIREYPKWLESDTDQYVFFEAPRTKKRTARQPRPNSGGKDRRSTGAKNPPPGRGGRTRSA